MSTQRQVHAQLMDLKEPLISDPTVERFELGLLESFINDKKQEKASPIQSAVYNPPESKEKPNQNPEKDFNEINKGLFNNADDFQKDKGDPFQFYKQAALQIEKPTTYVKSFCYLPSDPSIFATISVASKFFNKKEIKLKELIPLDDYKKLTTLRIQNYIFILRMFTQIDKSKAMYERVKIKLNHILKTCQMLDICNKEIEQSPYYITKMFYRLSQNQQIYNLDDDDQYMYSQDDKEYNDYFYGESSLNTEYYSHNLLNEEKKWVVRIQWIEEVISDFKKSVEFAPWVGWLEAKLDSLLDLDVQVNKSEESQKEQCSHIFYLHDFLEQQVNMSKKKAAHLKHGVGEEDPDLYLKDTYTEEQQTQLEQQAIYPKIKFTSDMANNDHNSSNRFMNVREKLSLKILLREVETDYFLTVFSRLNFGNEKVYEKRINTRKRTLDMHRFEFSPNGQFLYVAFTPKKIDPPQEEEEEAREEEEPEDDKVNEEEKKDEEEEKKEGEDNEEEEAENKEEEEEKDFSQRIDLIFPLNAHFKNPLLVKPNSKFLGFGEKTFVSFQQIEVSQDQQEENLIEIEGENKTSTNDGSFLRIYEHDLHNYAKIRALDLPSPFTKLNNYDMQTGRFGKNREGYYIIKDQKDATKAGGDSESRTFSLFKHPKEEYKIEIESIKSSDFKEQFCLNERGDKLLMIYWQSDDFKIVRFSLDSKKGPKAFRPDNFEYKSIKQLLANLDKGVKFIENYKFKIVPASNDFLIMLSRTKLLNEVSFILGDNILNQTNNSNIDEFTFLIQDSVSKIYQCKDQGQITFSEEWKEEGFNDNENCEYFSYNYLDIDNKKRDWIAESFKTINRVETFCYPYMFFIYNHDQLYMKDFRLPKNDGYYYMNNYLGITSKMRPITVQCYQNNNSMTLNVPIIESSYSEQQFLLRVNSLVTVCQMSDPFTLTNTYLEYHMYGYNEEIMQGAGEWARILTDADGKLEKDIRISMKQNCLVIEKWDKNRVNQRVLITQYDSYIDRKNRDVTNIKNNTESTLGIIQKSYRLLIYHNKDNIQIYCFNLDKHWSYFDFSNPEELETIFTFPDDEVSNPFYDVMVDTLVKGQIDIYVLQSSGQMKRLTAKIPTDPENADQLNFAEYEYIYQVDRVFSDKQKQSLKKINLYQQKKDKINYFIANQIFYSSQYNPIDLRAEVFSADQKMQLGFDIELPLNRQQSYIQFSNVSLYDGRIYIQEENDAKYYNCDENDLIDNIVSLPLINSRVLPQFHHSQFNHPIVPLVNIEEGYISVFTLNLENTLLLQMFNIYYGGVSERYPAMNILSHENSQYARFQFKSNLTPGILIKYFSGVEERIPLKDNFLKIDRFVISKDGLNILIAGHRANLSQDGQISIENGLFVYKIDRLDYKAALKCMQFFPWAQFKKQNDVEPLTIKFGISELSNDACVGQYEPEDGEQDFKRYHGMITNDGYIDDSSPEQQLQVEQSDDEDETYITPRLNQVPLPKQIILGAENQIKFTEASVINKKEKRFSGFDILFKGFDIPYYANENILDEFNFIKFAEENNNQDDGEAKKEEVNNNYNAQITFKADSEREMKYYPQPKLSDADNQRLQKIHANIHLSINENGQIFLVNRISNKLYFFYQDERQIYKLQKITAKNIKLCGADTSKNILLLWGREDYQLYDIGKLIGGQYDSEAIRIGMQQGIYTGSENIFRLTLTDSIQMKKQVIIPKTNAVQEEQIDEYIYEILECKLLNDWVILRIKEEQDSSYINYLKIFDFRKQTVVGYFEYDQLMLSGDKKFIWLPIQDKVYDIQNYFSTLFLWPGGQINTAGVDEMDIFNISEDLSMMITHGKINLAFDLISSCNYPTEKNGNNLGDTLQLQSEIENSAAIESKSKLSKNKSREKEKMQIQNAIDPGQEKDFRNRYLYLFYNLPNQMNLVSRILNMKDSLNKTRSSIKSVKGDDSNNLQIIKENLMMDLVNYLNKNSNNQLSNILKYAEFMLSLSIDSVNQEQSLGNKEQEGPKEVTLQQNIFQFLFSSENPRKDIIEEILNYVVQSINNPITQNVIFKNFIEFLESADTSQAFRQYLESGIMKTAKMKSTQKYAIASNEQGYTIQSYVSPIMDEGFHRKFQNGESKIDVQIQNIFLGDLIETKGEKILDVLSDQKFTQIMSIPFIKYLVTHQWKTVRSTIELRSLYPFYALLASYTIYTLFLVNYVDYLNSRDQTSFLNILFYFVLVIMQMVILVYFLGLEAKQFYNDRQEYFKSLWNFSDILSYSLAFLVILLDLINTDSKALLRPVASITLIIMWIKMFYFLRVYDVTSKLIRMIIQIIMDMKYFLFVLFIGVIAFAGGFYIMQDALVDIKTDQDLYANTPKDGNMTKSYQEHYPEAFSKRFAGSNPLLAIIYTYRLAMGDFGLDTFADFKNPFEAIFIWAIFLVGSLFLVIVLLNLLIAIMGASFQDVQSNIQNLTIREELLLVAENESMFDRKQIFRDAQYLIIISEGKGESSSIQATVDTLLNTLKQQLFAKVNNLDSNFKSQISETLKDLKRKFQDQEEKQKLSFNESEQRYTGALRQQLDETVSKINETFTDMRQQIQKIDQISNVQSQQAKVIEKMRDVIQKANLEQKSLKLNIYKNLKIKEEDIIQVDQEEENQDEEEVKETKDKKLSKQ